MPTLHPGEEENLTLEVGSSDIGVGGVGGGGGGGGGFLPAGPVKRTRPCRLHLEFPALQLLAPAPQSHQPAVAPATGASPGSPLSPISANPSVLQAGRKRRKGASLHDFHGKLQAQQQEQQQYSECDVETAQFPNVGPTRVLDHLYIGSQADSLDSEVMRRFGITHVLNVSIACPQSQHVLETNFLRIPVNDGYTDKLLPHFQRAFNFLESVRETSGRCLVHCLAGISRSPTLSIAYIMMHCKMSQEEAYRFVKQRRQHISPNFNFLGQLVEFERQLRRGSGEAASLASLASLAPAQPPAPADDRGRPETKRQRTCAGTPPGLLSELSSGVAGRPRSVLLSPPGPAGSGIDGLSVRRSRSSDAFLMEVEAECDPRAQEPPAGPVACLS